MTTENKNTENSNTEKLAFLKVSYDPIPALTVGLFDSSTNILTIPLKSDLVTLHVDPCHVDFINFSKTGDMFSHKICNSCHRLLPISNFKSNQKRMSDASTIFRPSCNDCRSTRDGINLPRSARKKHLPSKPHNSIIACPSCKKYTIAGVTSKYVLDHDHKTGKIRGWLCDTCNTGVGRFEDDPLLMLNALEYILDHSNTSESDPSSISAANIVKAQKLVKQLRSLLES